MDNGNDCDNHDLEDVCDKCGHGICRECDHEEHGEEPCVNCDPNDPCSEETWDDEDEQGG